MFGVTCLGFWSFFVDLNRIAFDAKCVELKMHCQSSRSYEMNGEAHIRTQFALPTLAFASCLLFGWNSSRTQRLGSLSAVCTRKAPLSTRCHDACVPNPVKKNKNIALEVLHLLLPKRDAEAPKEDPQRYFEDAQQLVIPVVRAREDDKTGNLSTFMALTRHSFTWDRTASLFAAFRCFKHPITSTTRNFWPWRTRVDFGAGFFSSRPKSYSTSGLYRLRGGWYRKGQSLFVRCEFLPVIISLHSTEKVDKGARQPPHVAQVRQASRIRVLRECVLPIGAVEDVVGNQDSDGRVALQLHVRQPSFLMKERAQVSIVCQLHLAPCQWLPTSRTRVARA